jgi:voltage-gated potassium channel
VSTLGYAAASIVEYLVGGHLGARVAQRRKEQALARLESHFVVCGYGRVGSQLAASLRDEGRQVVVIEDDWEQYQQAEADGVPALHGDAASSALLREAGVERAAGVLVATGGDAENVYTVLAARALAPEVPVVARASTSEAVERLSVAGAVRVFSPHVEGAQSMASYMLRPKVGDIVTELLDPRSAGITIEQFEVQPESVLLGRSIGDLHVDERYGVVLLAITSDEQLEAIPSPSATIQVGDVLVVVGRPDNVERFGADCREGDIGP